MKSFNDINLAITGDVNQIGFTNILGLIVGKTTGTTASYIPAEIDNSTPPIVITVPIDSCAGWEIGGTVRCHVDLNGNNYYEYLNNAAQIETATAVGTIVNSGNATVILTSNRLPEGVVTLSVAVEEEDTPEMWAQKVRTALSAVPAVSSNFIVGGFTDKIVLVNKPLYEDQYPVTDTTLNLSLANATCSGITDAPNSTDTTDGAQYEPSIVGTITNLTPTSVTFDPEYATPTIDPVVDWIVSYKSPSYASTLNSLINNFKSEIQQLEDISL